MKIKKIHSRQILDSRGNPTVEVEVTTENGTVGRAAVPSGASTGEHEALELRDGGDDFDGKGVRNALKNIQTEIAPALKGMDVNNQKAIDNKMLEIDGTENKSRLGANAILGVSLAVAHVAANANDLQLYEYIGGLFQNKEFTLPRPMINILNGGQHADNEIAIQEFMIVPVMDEPYPKQLQSGVEIFHALGKVLEERSLRRLVGDEGGYAPQLNNSEEALELILEAVERAGYSTGDEIGLALDVAASEFYSDETYNFNANLSLKTSQMIEWIATLSKDFPIISVEDGLDEEDWEGWHQLMKKTGERLHIVGDDLLVTDRGRLQRAIDESAVNSILIKPNQIGTLTETLMTMKLARENDITTIVSHRSGETEDTTITHLAVGTNSQFIKTGSVSRGERTAKFNELLRINENI